MHVNNKKRRNNMFGKIINIQNVDEKEYSGYKIVTDKFKIIFAIDNYQQCCETWGYFETKENLNDLIGQELLSIATTDPDYSTTDIKYIDISDEEIDSLFKKYNTDIDYLNDYYHTVECCFVNLQTNLEFVQLAVYNEHNGYYGHDIYFKIEKL